VPKGPKGEKRPADVIGNAVKVMRIAVGDIEEDKAKSGKSRSGKAGAAARTAKLSSSRRSEIAKAAAKARWDSSKL
jgi:hypothetical protein